ncbi:MAG TPA: response regulator transcription factor, partial [Candidatus Limnocylindrales bacterium]|nr:response regulator transcription factor [Candidatus Limnocylindrales bacterium]
VREALAIAEFLERPEGRGLGMANLAGLLLYAGRLDEAFGTAVDGMATVRSIGLERTYGGSLAATAAAAAYLQGRWTEARELCAQALAVLVPGPEAVWPGAVAMRLAAGCGDEGLMQSGRAVAEPFLAAATDRLHAAWYWLGSIEAELVADRTGSAQEHAVAAIDRLPPDVVDETAGSLFAFALRIAAERAETARAAEGDRGAAASSGIAAQLVAEWRRRRSSVGSATPVPEVAEALGALCDAEAGRAHGVADPPAWERAALAHERLGLVYPGAYARFRQAESILQGASPRTPRAAQDARSAAAGPLKMAMQAAQRIGARPLVASVVLLARRARLDAPSPEEQATGVERTATEAPPIPTAAAFVERRGLTPREVEILALIGSGWSNGEIASALYISRKTASVHVSNILGKLDVGDRVEAGALAQRAGLVGPPRPGSVLPELDPDL